MNLQAVNLASIVLRLAMAALFGGVIGFERETSKHPAGLRTHMLICIGSTLVMLTGQYVFKNISSAVDPTRMGAQVISGIGFLGVGTIIIVGREHVRGLTTAAGLWASACMGLAIGIGFYSGAIVGGLLIFVIIVVLQRFDGYISKHSKLMDLYIEVDNSSRISELQDCFSSMNVKIQNIDMSREHPVCNDAVGITIYLKLFNRTEHIKIVTDVMKIQWVCFVQEI
jgi:putative Mg2+ transporter-C (MgtC) family protein